MWITQDEYDNYRKRFRHEQQKYRDRLARLEQADEEYYMTVNLLLQVASRSYEIFMGSEPEERIEIIQLVFQNLWMNDKKLEYVMQKPFDSIFESGKHLNWGG